MALVVQKICVQRKLLSDVIKSRNNEPKSEKRTAVLEYVLNHIGIENLPCNSAIINFVLNKLDQTFLNNFWLKFTLVQNQKKGFNFFEKKEKKWLEKDFSFEFNLNEINKLSAEKIQGNYHYHF